MTEQTTETVEIQTSVYAVFAPISPEWDPQLYQIGALRLNGAKWGRAQYEATCQAAGVEPMTDAEIATAAYALTYAEYRYTEWTNQTRAQRVGHILAGRRLAGIEAEKQAARRPVAVEMVKCSCGHTVTRGSVMSASMGTSCPDCYDRMSD